jgi:hypothetical protein
LQENGLNEGRLDLGTVGIHQFGMDIQRTYIFKAVPKDPYYTYGTMEIYL